MFRRSGFPFELDPLRDHLAGFGQLAVTRGAAVFTAELPGGRSAVALLAGP